MHRSDLTTTAAQGTPQPSGALHLSPGSKDALLAQHAADLLDLEAEIGRLTEQRTRLLALQALVRKTPTDLLDTLLQGRDTP